MKRIFLIAVFFTIPITMCAQSMNWAYLLKGNSDENKTCFQVIELTIHEDNSFTSITYGCGERKSWKNFKSWKSKIVKGRIDRTGDYTLLNEYKNGFKTKTTWKIKINDKSVSYYAINSKGKMKRTAKYKRTKLD